MDIATTVCEQQDVKEMTRRAISILENCGAYVDDLKEQFLDTYGEEA